MTGPLIDPESLINIGPNLWGWEWRGKGESYWVLSLLSGRKSPGNKSALLWYLINFLTENQCRAKLPPRAGAFTRATGCWSAEVRPASSGGLGFPSVFRHLILSLSTRFISTGVLLLRKQIVSANSFLHAFACSGSAVKSKQLHLALAAPSLNL